MEWNQNIGIKSIREMRKKSKNHSGNMKKYKSE